MEPTAPGFDRPAEGPPGGADPAGRLAQGAFGRPRIAVVRNPRSHRNRIAAQPDAADPGIELIAPGNREDLARALARFAAEGIDLLVIDGGDGTMREVLTAGAPAFGEHWPALMILPKGKTNALAIDLAMPGKWSLGAALAAAPEARTVVRRPLLLEREDTPARPVMGFIMGAGAFTTSIATGQVAHRFGAFQGFAVAVTALSGVIQALFGIGRSRWRAVAGMKLRGAGTREVPQSRGVSGSRFGIGLSTLSAFPLGMQPFGRPGAHGQGGIRYLVVDAPLRRVVALVPAILMGFDRPFLTTLGVHRGAADVLELEFEERFILDGEAFAPGRYRLRLGPELRFLVP